MDNIRQHMEVLGLPAEDKVAGAKGIITSISFDLFGCIQCLLRSPIKKDGSEGEVTWYDIKRLKILKGKRVMPIPDYDEGYVAKGRQGAEEKPIL